MSQERRRYPRYRPVDAAYAALGSDYSKVGRIINFSYGGLSFEYLAGRGQKNTGSSVDVFIMDNTFHIHNLPCEVIYDVSSKAPATIGGAEEFTVRTCAVRFRSPADQQKSQITLFICEHTDSRDEAPESY